MKIKVKKINATAMVPTYAHKGDAGMDLYVPQDFSAKYVHPGDIVEVDHGIALEIPLGFFGLIRPRSGIASSHGLSLSTSGTIDSGYRGSIKTHWTVVAHSSYQLSPGDKIAQMIIVPTPQVELEEVEELSGSSRGEKGHGSTGR